MTDSFFTHFPHFFLVLVAVGVEFEAEAVAVLGSRLVFAANAAKIDNHFQKSSNLFDLKIRGVSQNGCFRRRRDLSQISCFWLSFIFGSRMLFLPYLSPLPSCRLLIISSITLFLVACLRPTKHSLDFAGIWLLKALIDLRSFCSYSSSLSALKS